LQGRYTASSGLSVGYFAQHQVQTLHLESSPFEHVLRLDKTLTDQQIRDYLGGFGFHGDEALQSVGPMSGGEKARLVLALVVYTKPNLLLLDAPTNHLDMNMREALSFALQSYEGAMVIVSHDRYLLESVCDEFYLVDNKQVSAFSGDLSDYQKWLFSDKQQKAVIDKQENTGSSTSNQTSSADKKERKRQEAEFRQATKVYRDTIAKSEKQMNKYQQELQEIETEMANPDIYLAENKARLNKLIARQVEAKNGLEENEMDWLDAQEKLEDAQAALN
jgi:ATP-binding cassette subfamily F protein 3